MRSIYKGIAVHLEWNFIIADAIVTRTFLALAIFRFKELKLHYYLEFVQYYILTFITSLVGAVNTDAEYFITESYK